MDISILICTRNRAHQLEKMLGSLSAAIANASGMRTEVVLIDNGSSDHTQAVIAAWAGQMPFPVQNVVETKPGLSAARNAGIAHARGETIVFTDDDCTLNPDYLIVLKRYISTDTQPVIRGGKVELGDPTDIPFTILLGDVPKRLQEPTHPFGFIIGANMVIPRSIIRRVGLFDERFGAGTPLKAGEESDYIYRAYRLGIPVEYVPDLVVQHFHGRKDRSAIGTLSHGYSISGGALYTKYYYDKNLLKHFYWDIKNALHGMLKGDMIFNKEFNITCPQFLKASFTGVGLYMWQTVRPWKK